MMAHEVKSLQSVNQCSSNTKIVEEVQHETR